MIEFQAFKPLSSVFVRREGNVVKFEFVRGGALPHRHLVFYRFLEHCDSLHARNFDTKGLADLIAVYQTVNDYIWYSDRGFICAWIEK